MKHSYVHVGRMVGMQVGLVYHHSRRDPFHGSALKIWRRESGDSFQPCEESDTLGLAASRETLREQKQSVPSGDVGSASFFGELLR